MGVTSVKEVKKIKKTKLKIVAEYARKRALGLQAVLVAGTGIALSVLRPGLASEYQELMNILLACSLTATLVDLVRKQHNADDWVEPVAHIAVEIFVAVGIGALLNLLFHSFRGGSNGEHESIAWGEEVAKTLALAVLVFGANLVAESTGTVNRFSTSISELKKFVGESQEIIDTARETFSHAQYAGVAAKALNIRRDFLEIDSRPDQDLGVSLEPTLNSLKAWLLRGQVILEQSGDLSRLKRAAWWRVMRIYHQEEVFDVGRFEVATNVRNYAFILVGLMAEFLKAMSLKKPPEGLKKRKLVVLQVTPFAPKDFYNFPNGTASQRFYHEPEYFGTYRRVLSMIARDKRVQPLRIFLAASSSKELTKKFSGLGWTLDSVGKVVLDCARYHIVPMPLSMRSRRVESEPKSSRWDLAGEHDPLMSSLCIKFPAHHNPALRLPHVVDRVLWSPTYVDLRRADGPEFFRRLPKGFQGFTSYDLRGKWAKRSFAFDVGETDPDKATHNDALSTRLSQIRNRGESLWAPFLEVSDPGGNLSPSSFVSREREAWEAMLDRFCAECEIDRHVVNDVIDQGLEGDPKDRRERIAGALQGKKKEEKELVLDEVHKHIDLLTHIQQISGRCSEEHKRQLAEAEKRTDGVKEKDGVRERVYVEKEFVEQILALVDTCQAVDSSFQFLDRGRVRVAKDSESGPSNNTPKTWFPISSAGTDLGLAENWLHRFLILLESQRWKGEMLTSGPIPLWKLFASDLFGIEAAEMPQVQKGLFEATRLCVIGEDNSPDVVASAQDIEATGIASEFLLLGLSEEEVKEEGEEEGGRNANDNKNQEPLSDLKVDWQVLVRAEINEPFHTCRASIRFKSSESAEDDVHVHGEWARSIWRKADNATRKFLDELALEVQIMGDEQNQDN